MGFPPLITLYIYGLKMGSSDEVLNRHCERVNIVILVALFQVVVFYAVLLTEYVCYYGLLRMLFFFWD